MKKPLTLLLLVIATLAVAVYASSGAGCCTIPQRQSVTAAASDKVANLHIEGMTCGSCATAVRHVLTRVDGVKDADVSYKNKTAVVTYDSARVTPEKIARSVEEKLPTYKAEVRP